MTVEFPCHRERQRGDPPEKVRGIYSVLYSKGLPRSFHSLAMTVIFSLPGVCFATLVKTDCQSVNNADG